MSPAVYDNTVAAVAFWSAVLGWELVEWRQQRREARAAEDVDHDRASGRLVNLTSWVAIGGAYGLGYADVGRIPGGRWPVYGVGFGLLAA